MRIRLCGGYALFVLLACQSGRADEMLTWDEGDRVVYSNTPSRAEARSLKGFEAKPAPAAVPYPTRKNEPLTGYDDLIGQVARDSQLDPTLIKAVAHVESGFNPQAVSPKGAQGLMQLMPATARQYGVTNAFDPHENLRAGAQHLRGLLDEFQGNEKLALAAYNAGAGAVRRHQGVPRYRETQDYVRKVQEQRSLWSQGGSSPAPVSAPRGEDVQLQQRPDGSLMLSN